MTDRQAAYEQALDNLKTARTIKRAAEHAFIRYAADSDIGPNIVKVYQRAITDHGQALDAYRAARIALKGA